MGWSNKNQVESTPLDEQRAWLDAQDPQVEGAQGVHATLSARYRSQEALMPPTDRAQHDTAPEPAWEVVAHIWSFYDVAQEGLAHFEGKPHVFFGVEENYRPDPEDPDEFIRETVYALHPASEALVASLREKNDIFERWHRAWSASQGQRADHPALPEDRERYEALKADIDPQLEALRKTKATRYQVGNFAGNRRPVAPGGSRWTSFEVQWTNERS